MTHAVIRQVRIADPAGPHHGQTLDIEINNGRIVALDTNIDAGDAVEYAAENLHASPGWVDLEAEVGEPGLEHREDIESLCRAAALGGFTRVGVRPDVQPVRHDRAGIQYLLSAAHGTPVQLLPYGSVSRDLAGADITEMMDMHHAGALAFTDGSHNIQHAGLMQRALEYVLSFKGLIMHQPLDGTLAGKGHLHEGIVSTRLGMRGIPSLAEYLQINRDIQLLAYTGSRLHISHVSTAEGVAAIAAAKAQGLKVTASVAALNLLLDVEALEDFDSNLKVLPPLRHATDRAALIQGLKNGTIDAISSNHSPREIEAKAVEFPYADFGAATIELAYALAQTALGLDGLDLLVKALSYSPRSILGLPQVQIAQGQIAELTFFQPHLEWTPRRSDFATQGANIPLTNQSLLGKAKGIAAKGAFFWQ